ncbi:metallophosphoesterase [Fructilactobacillus sp. Tb1]|uniref:metallophosphoesterase n=1 Tax=Fructilactobacillus sp. Tb1 TaxID=3422304 RepID=UPI003D29EC4F
MIIKKYAFISDIHSDIHGLMNIEKLKEFNDPDTQFIFVGDYIDGPYQPVMGGIKVIRYVRKLVDSGKAIALQGNHDTFMTGTADGNLNAYQTWAINGMTETLKSFGITETTERDIRNTLNAKYKSEIEFLKSLPLIWINKNIIAVHAGIEWGENLTTQSEDVFLWIRNPYFYEDPFEKVNPKYHHNDTNKIIVSGHTPTMLLKGEFKSPVKSLKSRISSPIYSSLLKADCPIAILQSDKNDIPRYMIDGGEKAGMKDNLNVLVLNEDGSYVRGGKIKSLVFEQNN